MEPSTILAAYSIYNLPSIEALIRYYHITARFPIKETQCKVIAKGNYSTWPGLNKTVARKYYPNAIEITIGTMS